MAFLRKKNGDYAPCLKYSVRIFNKYLKCSVWRLAARYDTHTHTQYIYICVCVCVLRRQRVKSMKNPNDPMRNQTRDPPACSAVPQPTTSLFVPQEGTIIRIHGN
jgi:hypothetical protein